MSATTRSRCVQDAAKAATNCRATASVATPRRNDRRQPTGQHPRRRFLSLAAALIKARGEADMTQEQVAEAMGTTQAAVARLESGRTMPSTRTLERFALLAERVAARFLPPFWRDLPISAYGLCSTFSVTGETRYRSDARIYSRIACVRNCREHC